MLLGKSVREYAHPTLCKYLIRRYTKLKNALNKSDPPADPHAYCRGGKCQQNVHDSFQSSWEQKSIDLPLNHGSGDFQRWGEAMVNFCEQIKHGGKLAAGNRFKMKRGDAKMVGGGLGGAIHCHPQIARVQVFTVIQHDGLTLLHGHGTNGADEGGVLRIWWLRNGQGIDR